MPASVRWAKKPIAPTPGPLVRPASLLYKEKVMVRALAFAVSLLVGNFELAQAQDKPLAATYRFEIVESGSFFEKTVKEMGTKEAAAMITAACAAFGVDCSQEAAAGTEALKTVINSDSVAGEEHHGIIRAPVGYEICKAKVDWGHASIDGESTFNTAIVRTPNDNGLGYYAVVPKHRKEGHSVKATLYLEFVPGGTTSQYGCWPTGLNPWICKGQSCSQFYPEAHL